MPGMDGKETSTRINKLFSGECTIVAMTANNWDVIRGGALKVGVENHLEKPLNSANIVGNIEQIARRSNMNLFKEKENARLSDPGHFLALFICYQEGEEGI